MKFSSAEKLVRTAAISAAVAFGTGALSEKAFAQTSQAERGVSGGAAREAEQAVDNVTFVTGLGLHPVVRPGERMTPESARLTGEAIERAGRTTHTGAVALSATLEYLGAQQSGGGLQTELAQEPRDGSNEPGWLPITSRLQGLPQGASVEIRYNGVNSQRLLNGMTEGDGNGGVRFLERDRFARGAVTRTTVVEIKVTYTVNGQQVTDLFVYFDKDCSNVSPAGHSARVAAESRIDPCAPTALENGPMHTQGVLTQVYLRRRNPENRFEAHDEAIIRECLGRSVSNGSLSLTQCPDNTCDYGGQALRLILNNLPENIRSRVRYEEVVLEQGSGGTRRRTRIVNENGEYELIALRPLSFELGDDGRGSYLRPRMVLPGNAEEAALIGATGGVQGLWDVYCLETPPIMESDQDHNAKPLRSNNVSLDNVYQADGRTETEAGETIVVDLNGPDARRNTRWAIVEVDRPGTINDTLSDVRGDHTWRATDVPGEGRFSRIRE